MTSPSASRTWSIARRSSRCAARCSRSSGSASASTPRTARCSRTSRASSTSAGSSTRARQGRGACGATVSAAKSVDPGDDGRRRPPVLHGPRVSHRLARLRGAARRPHRARSVRARGPTRAARSRSLARCRSSTSSSATQRLLDGPARQAGGARAHRASPQDDARAHHLQQPQGVRHEQAAPLQRARELPRARGEDAAPRAGAHDSSRSSTASSRTSSRPSATSCARRSPRSSATARCWPRASPGRSPRSSPTS